MITSQMEKILKDSRPAGWVLEPLAKQIMQEAGMHVPNHLWAKSEAEALKGAKQIGYPVVAKVVSPQVVHKSEVSGVAVGIKDDAALKKAYSFFEAMDGFAGVLVEEMVAGVELIMGAKQDPAFGPVVLAGIGGTAVEIYKDTTLRLAPVDAARAREMILELKGVAMLTGFRGAEPVSLDAVAETLSLFSELAAALGEAVESIDLNPVICTANRCLVADARIILPPEE